MTCLRGASAVQSVLDRQPNAQVRVFVIWEPILATDFAAPAAWVLRRVPDRRVQQYWDRDHLVARRMAADARPPQPEPECCLQGEILWDLVALYPPGAVWDDRLPAATLFNGPVVELQGAIESALGVRRSALGGSGNRGSLIRRRAGRNESFVLARSTPRDEQGPTPLPFLRPLLYRAGAGRTAMLGRHSWIGCVHFSKTPAAADNAEQLSSSEAAPRTTAASPRQRIPFVTPR